MQTTFERYCDRQRQQHGAAFVAPTDSRWITAYNFGSCYRVQVQFATGDVAWGYVSLTTGWQPAFLLMRNRRCHGSSLVLGDRDQIVNRHWLRG